MTSFIGREQEVTELVRMVTTARLLTLAGAGGIGKTRVALEVARKVLASYADGVWLAELAAAPDGPLVLQAVASAVGVQELAGRTLAAALEEAVSSRHMLLVLDNCEHVVQACADLVVDLLRGCPHLTVLATSRESLGMAGEIVWTLQPLAVPPPEQSASPERVRQAEAVQLFVERAGAASPGFGLTERNASSVADVCRRLEGIPLALELAAARVNAVSVDQIAERLHDHFRLLAGGRSAPPRHQTLRACIEWSYELLTQQERLLFERLSVFVGGWTLEAAEVVGAGDAVTHAEVADLLARLVDKSLVLAESLEVGSGRYRLLEPLRDYAEERLRQKDETGGVDLLHADYFLDLAEQAAPHLLGRESAASLARLEREHDNLRAALRRTIRRVETRRAQRIGAALARFWFFHGHWEEGRRWLAELVALGRNPDEILVQARLIGGFGQLALFQSDYVAAQPALEEALALTRGLGDNAESAWWLYQLGRLAAMRGELVKARVYYEQGAESAGVDAGAALRALNVRGLADAAYSAGDYTEARERGVEALALAKAAGEDRTLSLALRVLGKISYRQGNYPAARAFLEQAVEKAREVGDRVWIASSLPELAEVMSEQGETGRASSLVAESLALHREIGDRWGTARDLEVFAQAAAAQDQPARALRLAASAAALREALDAPVRPPDQAALNRHLARARHRLGTDASAAAWAEGRAMPLDEAITEALRVEAMSSIEQPAVDLRGPTKPTLTPREQEVVALITRGLSNRRIGEALVIAEPTVVRHVSNILGKLALDSRAQVAIWALQHGLAADRQSP